MKFSITFTVVFPLLAHESSAQDVRIRSLRAFANGLTSSNQVTCTLPTEVQGTRNTITCDMDVAYETSRVVFFEKFGGSDKRCVRSNGSARTNGSFANISTAEGCADKCMGKETSTDPSGFNFHCEAKICQCLYGDHEIEETIDKSGSTCYKFGTIISGTWPVDDDGLC